MGSIGKTGTANPGGRRPLEPAHASVNASGSSARPPGDLRGRDLAFITVLLFVLAAVPVATHRLPPLSDYVNHLATAHVINAIGVDPDLRRFYEVEWRLIPNLMIDIVVPLLDRLVSVYTAGQMFTLSIFGLILSGMLALNRALFGRWSAAPLIAAPLLYNGVLLIGVMNYLFGIGLALWALAVWVALRERAWPWRIALSAVLLVALYVCHLYAVGLYGIGLFAIEAQRLWARRAEPLVARLSDFVLAGLPFLPVAVLLATSRTWESPGVPAFWEFGGKLTGLMLAIGVYHPETAWALLALAAAALSLAAARGHVRFHPAGRALLAVGAIVYLGLPRALFAAHAADQRLPIALAFMLAACLQLDLPTRGLRRGFVGLLFFLVAIRVAEVQVVWNELASGPLAARASVSSIDRGSRVLVVHGDRTRTGLISDLGLLHVASLATIERSALVTTNFTVPGKHVLQMREAFRAFVETEDRVPPSIRDFVEAAARKSTRYYDGWPDRFDYVFILFTMPRAANPDPAHLALIHDGEGFQLYRVSGRK